MEEFVKKQREIFCEHFPQNSVNVFHFLMFDFELNFAILALGYADERMI